MIPTERSNSSASCKQGGLFGHRPVSTHNGEKWPCTMFSFQFGLNIQFMPEYGVCTLLKLVFLGFTHIVQVLLILGRYI